MIFFHLCLASLRLYPEWQAEVQRISKHKFEFSQSGSLHIVYHEADILSLETRLAWQREWGAEADLLTGAQARALEPELAPSVVAAMYYPEESHLFAPDYVRALEAACRNNGVVIEDELQAVEIDEWKNGVVLRARNGRSFNADRLVVCTGAWAQELAETFAFPIPIYPIRGQICAYELPPNTIKHILYSSQGYLVPKANGTLVNGASEDIAGFQTEVTEQGIERLTNWNHQIFPFLKELKPFHRWAGLRPATQDGYPLIGELEAAPQVIMACGHYRNGILLSPITAITVADLIEGQSPAAPIECFKPERFT